MRSKKQTIPVHLIAVSAVASLFLAGCANGGDTTGQDTQTVSVGASQFAGFASVLSLEDEEEAETDVEIVEFGNSADRGVALVTGEIDMALLGWTQVLQLAEDETTDLAVLASNFEDGRTIIAADDSGIESIEDLEDKTVAYSVGSMVDLDLKTQLSAAGMSIDDVDEVNMPFTDMVIALENGDVDAYYGSEPQSSSSLAAGSGYLLQYPYDEPYPVPYGNVNGALVTTNAYLEENSETAEAFLRDYTNRTDELNSNEEALTQEISQITGEDEEVLNYTLDNLQLTYSLDGYEEKIDELTNTLLDMGFIDEAPVYEDYVDSSYLDSVSE